MKKGYSIICSECFVRIATSFMWVRFRKSAVWRQTVLSCAISLPLHDWKTFIFFWQLPGFFTSYLNMLLHDGCDAEEKSEDGTVGNTFVGSFINFWTFKNGSVRPCTGLSSLRSIKSMSSHTFTPGWIDPIWLYIALKRLFILVNESRMMGNSRLWWSSARKWYHHNLNDFFS